MDIQNCRRDAAVESLVTRSGRLPREQVLERCRGRSRLRSRFWIDPEDQALGAGSGTLQGRVQALEQVVERQTCAVSRDFYPAECSPIGYYLEPVLALFDLATSCAPIA